VILKPHGPAGQFGSAKLDVRTWALLLLLWGSQRQSLRECWMFKAAFCKL